MKLALAVFTLSLAMLGAKKSHKHLRETDPAWSHEETPHDFFDMSSSVTAGFDMVGKLRRTFAMNAALERPTQSVICSPISALLPLGKLVLGSHKGVSREELLSAVGASKSQVKKKFKALLKELQFLPGVSLSVASRLFVSKDSRLSSSYQSLTESVFKSSVEKLDFKSPSSAASSINRWVKEQTKGMITEMVTSQSVDPSASVIIVNAIYFGGMWNEPFRKVAVGEFHAPTGIRHVPMMTHESTYKFGVSKALGSQLIEVPYAKEKCSFVIVLPEARSGLTLLLQQLKVAPDLLNEAMEGMHPTRIKLTIPKFKIESEMNLIELYKKCGVKQIFNVHDSGLTRIVKDESVFVSEAVQKCVIEVSEKGTEASAASSVAFGLSYVKREEFIANRPFLFFIKVGPEQLFAGTYLGN